MPTKNPMKNEMGSMGGMRMRGQFENRMRPQVGQLNSWVVDRALCC
jgi:hypothetical protein